MSDWRYCIDRKFTLCSPWLDGVFYMGEWVRIASQTIEIATRYAWDGCSPAYRLCGDIWIGPWDGPSGRDGKPVTWQATLVHDALCQFRRDIRGLTKGATVGLFDAQLRADLAPAWMCQTYPPVVDLFGPQEWF
ncbi:hypothetical protein [Azonexus sp.]|uniref:hypothetical protein n=1 Tax=Azonexus sp. TaxID=1872668 RepID=UPI0027BAC5A6|nr:hypothetical protein [Azonexus sp.]